LTRFAWRSKQNLDFAFLMLQARNRGKLYLQLEDDVLAKEGFISTIYNFAMDRIVRKKPWIVIEFSELGFIGKLFNSENLIMFAQYLVMFYRDKPVDWLLESFLETKVCTPEQERQKCESTKSKLRVAHKPSLFQHIGTQSSLKGREEDGVIGDLY